MALKVTKEMIGENLPFSARMAWKLVPDAQKDQVVLYINGHLEKASNEASIDKMFDDLEVKLPAIKPVKAPLKESLKKTLKGKAA